MTEGADRRVGDVLRKYNIRDSKRFFSEINRQAQEGSEVITYDGLRPGQGEVSHIKTEVLDKVLSTFRFHTEWDYDSELAAWTVSVAELPVYGEGTDRAQASEKMIDALLEYVEVFYQDLRWFLNREETLSDFPYVRQVARCGGDRKKIADLAGLPHAD